jgi:outer membrane protein assembly factor BamD (BamD/ComL family)
VQIGLDGTGFLFLGFPDKTPQGDGMSFKGKENRNNKTWFSFQPLKLGTYDLDFLRQNNSTGQSTRETVRVHVVSDQEFSLAVNQQQAADQSSGGQAEPGDTAFAERLSGIGANEAAIAELLKGYKDGNPALNDQIASLYMRTRAYDAAGKYYQKNISPQTSYTTSAVLGLVHIAIAQKDQQAFMSYLKQFLAVQAPAMEETLIQAARMEKEKGETGVALDLAGEYTTRYPQGKWRDEATFLMAQILEADSRYRDIARARDLYLEVAQSYPEGAFASLARERLLYLERHFFEVR